MRNVKNLGKPELLFPSHESSLPRRVTLGMLAAATGITEDNEVRGAHLLFAFQSTLCSVDNIIARAPPPPLPVAKKPMAGCVRGVSVLQSKHASQHCG
jgi:hypothetical protein